MAERKKNVMKPKRVEFFDDMTVLCATFAQNHSIVIARTSEGEKKVYGFGENKNSKLSDKILEDKVTKPTEIEFFSNSSPESVVSGTNHTILTTETVNLDTIRGTH